MKEYEKAYPTMDFKQFETLVEKGFTDPEIMRFFGLSPGTIYNWKRNYPTFKERYEVWKVIATQQAVSTLYKKANGFTHIEEIKNEDGVVIDTKKTYIPPETNALMKFLTNVDPDNWKDKKSVESSGSVENKITINKNEARDRITNLLPEEDKELEEALS